MTSTGPSKPSPENLTEAKQRRPGPVPDGVALTPFDETFRNDPYTVYKDLRSREPIHRDSVGRYERSWTITSHDTARTLLASDKVSVDARKFGQQRDPRADNAVTRRGPDMMTFDEPDHTRLRSLVAQAFSPRSLDLFRPKLERVVRDRIALLKDNDDFDVVTDYAKPIPTIVIAELLGVDADRHEDFKRWTDTLLMQGFPMPSDEQWGTIVAADAALRDYIETVIAARRKTPCDDLISRLILARDRDDRLSEAEIVDMCALIIAGGNFTTTDLIASVVYNVLRTGGTVAGLHENPEFAAQVVEEVLRLDGPSLGVARFVAEDLEVGGIQFRAGDSLNILIAAANHDPEIWPAPDDFNVTRASRGHLAFGHGLHRCLGAPLARMEAQVALTALLQAFPGLALVDEPPQYRKVIGFRGLKRLQVTTSPRSLAAD